MIVYPAMDLLGGRCVRLSQGRFDAVTRYLTDPADALRQANRLRLLNQLREATRAVADFSKIEG